MKGMKPMPPIKLIAGAELNPPDFEEDSEDFSELYARVEALELAFAKQKTAHSKVLERLARHTSYFEALHRLVEQWKYTIPRLEGSIESLKLRSQLNEDDVLCALDHLGIEHAPLDAVEKPSENKTKEEKL